MPCNDIRHTVIVRTVLYVIFKIRIIKLRAIACTVWPRNGCIRVSLFDRVIVGFPGYVCAGCAYHRSPLIDGNINDGCVNVYPSKLVFGTLRRSVLPLPLLFPFIDMGSNDFLQHLGIVLVVGSNAKHSVVIAVVHHNLLAAAGEERFRHIQRISVGMFRPQSSLCSQHFGFQGHQGIGRWNIFI